MTKRTSTWWRTSAVILLAAIPAWAAEVAASATASVPAAQGTPAMAGGLLSDLLPAGTIFYKGWPGIGPFSEDSKDTELARLLNEPEVQQLRTHWWKKLWPAIEEQITAEIDDETGRQVFELARSLLATVWRCPTAVALIGAGMNEAGPQVDAAIIIRAGEEGSRLVTAAEKLLALARLSPDEAEEVAVGDLKFKGATVGPVPLRWGLIKEMFVFAVGTKATEHLGLGTVEGSLSRSPRFQAAMKGTGAAPDAPFAYLDLKSAVNAVRAFQPMLAASGVPVLSDSELLDRLLGQMGADTCESLSITIAPEAGGFKTSMFLHMPGASSSDNPLISRKPLINDDIGVVPKSARWATVANWDVLAGYRSVVGLLKAIVPGGQESVTGTIDDLEKRIGLSIEKDVLGAFDSTWALFDSSDFGGLWFSGTVLVAKVKPNHRLSKAMRNITEVIAEEIGGGCTAQVETSEYRGLKIEHVNISGIPMPIAPAWGEFQGRWVMALYPQMVRMELDHLMNRGASLLDNPDYQRGRKLMPAGPCAVSYVDTRAGLQQLYSFVLPVWQIGAAMLQKEDIPLDVNMLPSVQTLTRHTFGNVSASAVSDEGVLTVSYGSLPVALPALGEGGFVIPLGASILLPSLARARSQAKRTVSIANLTGIGRAMYVYATENDDKFPPDLQTLVDSGAISEKSLRSPLDESDATSSYVYISGQSTEVDQRNILAYENPENYDYGGTVCLFADSHVEFLSIDEFRKALKETYDRLGREMPDDLGAEAPKKTDTSPAGRIEAAKRLVGRSSSLAAAIELFKTNVGRYPKELKELLERPEEEAAAEKWSGPYVRNKASLKDPWDRDLLYLSPGKHNQDRYDLWSAGPDGEDGTDDDIGNWGNK